MTRAREWAQEAPGRAVLITGSITLVGEAIALADAGGWKPGASCESRTMSTDETSPATGRPARSRVRRERGVTETLLSVVLALEAAVLFFATLAIDGLTDIPTAVVVGGGAAAIVLFVVVAMVQRYQWGVVLGGVLQVGLIATGFLHQRDVRRRGRVRDPLDLVSGARTAHRTIAARRRGRSRRMSVEETLVLVKPDGVARNLTGEILRRIEAKGYQLVDIRMLQAPRDLLAAHYAEHEGKPFYEPLVEFMESGPIVAVPGRRQRRDRGLPVARRCDQPDFSRTRNDPR